MQISLETPFNGKRLIMKKWQIYPLLLSHIAIALSLFLWFSPSLHEFFQEMDFELYRFLNGSMKNNLLLQQFWAILNHPAENYINLVVMLGINILVIFLSPGPKRKRIIAQTLYFWIFFQLVLYFQHLIFSDMLNINRLSPSSVLEPIVNLRESFNNPKIKVFSENSFPAGHALVAIFWATFTCQIAKNNKITIITILTATLLCVARLMSGAHWASDIIFTLILGLTWVCWATSTPIYGHAVEWLERKL